MPHGRQQCSRRGLDMHRSFLISSMRHSSVCDILCIFVMTIRFCQWQNICSGTTVLNMSFAKQLPLIFFKPCKWFDMSWLHSKTLHTCISGSHKQDDIFLKVTQFFFNILRSLKKERNRGEVTLEKATGKMKITRSTSCKVIDSWHAESDWRDAHFDDNDRKHQWPCSRTSEDRETRGSWRIWKSIHQAAKLYHFLLQWLCLGPWTPVNTSTVFFSSMRH